MRLENQLDEAGIDEPNITPLIDIVFILLIFFVVTTTFARDLGLDIERPEASSGQTLSSRIVRIAVDPQGALTVDSQPTRSWGLEDALRARLDLTQEKAVLVISDRRVEATVLVDVIDAANRAGASEVSLAVEEAP
ncbi:MAG: biopolymer transporter ExbD [Myxococcota bacterium]